MRKNIYSFVIFLFIICSYLNNSLFSQEITGVEILPEYPTSADHIMFVVSTSFPFLECTLDSLHPYFACGAFAYDAFYGSSFDTGDCERTDTITLGQLPNGFYPITYRMYFLGWSQVDQVDTVITVGAVGIAEKKADESSIKIWPNPSPGIVNILPDIRIDQLQIHNSGGQLIKTHEISRSGYEQITLSLPAGLYICTPFRDGLPLPAQRFIVKDN